jgi:DNA repair exonuclease SbcCD nuclease subunit
MSIRFLHTADLQIGKTFRQFPPDVASKLRDARFETLKRTASLARDRRVDAVLVAGDCFDGPAVGEDVLRSFKVALEPFDGMWVLLPGNHDPATAESVWARLCSFSLPRNVVIAGEPSPIPIAAKAVLLPAPLRRRSETTDLTQWFDTAATGERLIRVGLAHGSVQELLPEGSEAHNPIARDRAERAGLDYLALGDWHGRLKVSVRSGYSGTPEPDRFRRNEPGHVLEVTIDGPGAMPAVEAIAVGRYLWMERAIDLSRGGADEIRDDIRRAIGESDQELERLVLRLQYRGTIDFATKIALDDVRGDLRARVCYLEDDDIGLSPVPTDDDLDSIDTAGFIRVGMNRLREKLGGPDAPTARRALEVLYGLHHRDRR